MGDFAQDQKDELEALESIYSEEITIIDDSPHRFSIPIKTEDFDPDEDTGRYVVVKFEFPPKYPSEGPIIEFEDEENLDDELLDEMKSHMETQVEENLGMPMIFTLVSAGIEWLGEKHDTLKREAEEAAKRKLEREEEEERKKLEGTKVTIESFLAWKAEFDRERLEKKGLKEKSAKDKLTGKELFQKDKTLNDSDVKFLATTGDEAVVVDESLFEDLEDLDIEEEESDDPDWNPGDISD